MLIFCCCEISFLLFFGSCCCCDQKLVGRHWSQRQLRELQGSPGSPPRPMALTWKTCSSAISFHHNRLGNRCRSQKPKIEAGFWSGWKDSGRRLKVEGWMDWICDRRWRLSLHLNLDPKLSGSGPTSTQSLLLQLQRNQQVHGDQRQSISYQKISHNLTDTDIETLYSLI